MIPNKPSYYASLSKIHDGLTKIGDCAYLGLKGVDLRANPDVDGLSIDKRLV